jgi:hypothetical protein
LKCEDSKIFEVQEQFNAFYPYSIYNYNAYPLVKELHSQCLEATIDFEIFCIDDASNGMNQ